jgi:hypothetical protein
MDARIFRSVELGALGATGERVGARAGNLNIDALRVVLCATDIKGRVESNDLVSQDIFAGGNAGRDRDSPGVVVGNQVI